MGQNIDQRIIVVGGGLAGCEAAYQAASRGVEVLLYEMRPKVMTPAHTTGLLAELVCSNSLKSKEITSAHGLLKEELGRLGSLLLKVANRHALPAGKALAVDRNRFAAEITSIIETNPHITIRREEVRKIPIDGIKIVATGPLTSPDFSREIQRLVGDEHLYFYDAITPIVSADSLNYSQIFEASRYRENDRSYLNIPLGELEYKSFWKELILGEKVPLHDFERTIFFEGCLPLEELARRGQDSLRFGPLKPVGLKDPKTGKRPFAVIQLRPENLERTQYSLVGFQTRLKYREQDRIFRIISALKDAQFLRYVSIHRNTYLNAPKLLLPTLQFRGRPDLFFAGQLTGVEGYVESIAIGFLAGLNASRLILKKDTIFPPRSTSVGALSHYLTTADPLNFQPMNINFGLLPHLEDPPRDRKERNERLAQRALCDLEEWKRENLV